MCKSVRTDPQCYLRLTTAPFEVSGARVCEELGYNRRTSGRKSGDTSSVCEFDVFIFVTLAFDVILHFTSLASDKTADPVTPHARGVS